MKEYVRISTTNNYYDLYERYSLYEIVDKVSTSDSIDGWLTLRDQKEELICIRASSVESIRTIKEQLKQEEKKNVSSMGR